MLDLFPEKVENYEEKLRNFYTEHIHADEEIRYCLEGSGYFDVRDKDDIWIRIWIKAGDLIVLPAGIYHRFTLDTGNYVKDEREEVIQAWYMDDSDEDQRLPHHHTPEEYVSLDQLAELGVLSWRLDADNYETDDKLKTIREERGYSYTDTIEVCPEKLPNYEEKIKNFFEEHLHTDEEIRYCLAGSGFFDVRDRNDAWIRVWVKKGGMIVLPAGIYHRFTLDTNNYIKAMRLFVGAPVWTPFNRPHDHLPARKEYVEAYVQKGAANHAIDAAA